jgi:hypothetical protein
MDAFVASYADPESAGTPWNHPSRNCRGRTRARLAHSLYGGHDLGAGNGDGCRLGYKQHTAPAGRSLRRYRTGVRLLPPRGVCVAKHLRRRVPCSPVGCHRLLSRRRSVGSLRPQASAATTQSRAGTRSAKPCPRRVTWMTGSQSSTSGSGTSRSDAEKIAREARGCAANSHRREQFWREALEALEALKRHLEGGA